MKLLLSYLKRYWKLCVFVLFLAAVNQTFSLLDPLIFRHVIDDYATKFNAFTIGQFFSGVGFLLLLSVGTAFVSRTAKNFQDYYLNTVTKRFGADIYADGVEHSLALPYAVFEDQRSGETLGLLQKTRTDTEAFISSFTNSLFVSAIGFVFVTVYAATIYWGVAVVFAATMPIVGGISLYLTRRVKSIQKQIVAETAALAGSTTESLRNIELVKSLGLVGQEIGRLNSTTGKILALELRKLKTLRGISFIQGTCINFMRTAILMFLLYLVFLTRITFGEFFSLYIYSFYVFGPLQDLGNVINSWREAEASLRKFQAILATPREPVPENPKDAGRVHDVAFKDVSFKYASAKGRALENVSWSAKAGETVAFVGPSGSGKTSLVKLLVGLYQPEEGIVSYNGVSGIEADMKLLRAQFGIVTQDTNLFAGSIKENLLFVNPTATDEEIRAALLRSAATPLLERASGGIDTLIGEGGIKVSGGEKQRISIARALLRKPAVLIFDEATSALDSLTEEEITKTIRDVGQGTGAKERITVLIAHRLSTVMHADRIYVLEKGRIAESGSHEELVAKGGLYQAMWRQQIGERI